MVEVRRIGTRANTAVTQRLGCFSNIGSARSTLQPIIAPRSIHLWWRLTGWNETTATLIILTQVFFLISPSVD